MTADWKDAKKLLPEPRIRVMVCDGLGFMQTAFWGYPSGGKLVETWYSDDVGGERFLDDVVFWDYFPESPFPLKGIFD